MTSVYGNPRPYASLELERHALIGRIEVARLIAGQARPSSEVDRWNMIIDELLDHLAELDARVESATMEQQCLAE